MRQSKKMFLTVNEYLPNSRWRIFPLMFLTSSSLWDIPSIKKLAVHYEVFHRLGSGFRNGWLTFVQIFLTSTTLWVIPSIEIQFNRLGSGIRNGWLTFFQIFLTSTTLWVIPSIEIQFNLKSTKFIHPSVSSIKFPLN